MDESGLPKEVSIQLLEAEVSHPLVMALMNPSYSLTTIAERIVDFAADFKSFKVHAISDIYQKKVKLEEVKEQMFKFEKQSVELRQECEFRRVKMKTLEAENADLKNAVGNHRTKLKDVYEAIDRVQKEKSKWRRIARRRSNGLKMYKKNNETALKALEVEKDSVKLAKEEARRAQNRLEEATNLFKKQSVDSHREVKLLEAQLVKLEGENADLKVALSESRLALKKVHEDLDRARNEKLEQQREAQVVDREQEIRKTNESVAGLESEKLLFLSNLCTEKLSNVNKAIDGVRKQKSKWRRIALRRSNRLNMLEKNNESAKKALEVEKDAVKLAKEELERVTTDLEKIKTANLKLQEDSSCKDDLEKMKIRYQAVKKEAERYGNMVKQMGKDLAELRRKKSIVEKSTMTDECSDEIKQATMWLAEKVTALGKELEGKNKTIEEMEKTHLPRSQVEEATRWLAAQAVNANKRLDELKKQGTSRIFELEDQIEQLERQSKSNDEKWLNLIKCEQLNTSSASKQLKIHQRRYRSIVRQKALLKSKLYSLECRNNSKNSKLKKLNKKRRSLSRKLAKKRHYLRRNLLLINEQQEDIARKTYLIETLKNGSELFRPVSTNSRDATTQAPDKTVSLRLSPLTSRRNASTLPTFTSPPREKKSELISFTRFGREQNCSSVCI